jgi:hypothetical protein
MVRHHHVSFVPLHAEYWHGSPLPSVYEHEKTPQTFLNLRRWPVHTLFSFCVPTLHINNGRNGDVVLNALIAEFIALGIEHHMTGKVPETQDFYEFPLCSNTIVSTCVGATM